MIRKKSQSAMEFLIMAGFVLFVFSGFFIIIQGNILQKTRENQEKDFKETALMVQDEINLATQSSDGYMREFTLPTRISGLDYDINITEGLIYIYSKDMRYAMAIPLKDMVGNLTKGKNIIKKEFGKVKLNTFMKVISTSFNYRETIPAKNLYNLDGCTGQNKNPQISIYNFPKETQTFAIIMEDIDAGNYLHWLVSNISYKHNIIPEDYIFPENITIENQYGSKSYGGPCPPVGDGTHRYYIHVYAVNKNITNNPTTKNDLMTEINPAIIDSAVYIGTYER
jgi:Raf kinase inhibitor-like YbhB/YbcL family protein